jgi:hypothetical protein
MPRYIVKSPHTAEDCKIAVKHFREHHAGFLSHYEWGCYDNDHTAYLMLEADSHEAALLTVPPLFRDKATAVELVFFNPQKPGDPLHSQKEENK